jgi:hypothetical protein
MSAPPIEFWKSIKGTQQRILICGGRDYDDKFKVDFVLRCFVDFLGKDNFCVIQGGARGADKLALDWCAANNVACFTGCAFWHTQGQKGGPIRNANMLKWFAPTVVIGFPGGKGTNDMLARAMTAGVPVYAI